MLTPSVNLLRSITAFFVLSSFHVKATILSDWQTGAQITAPDQWRTSFTPPDFPGFGARSYNTKDFTSVDFTVDDRKSVAPLTDKSDFVREFIRGVESQGSVITGRREQTLKGIHFLIVSLSTKGASGTNYMNAWFTIVKSHACQICLNVRESDPDKNETLNGIINSFTITDNVLPRSPVLTKQEQLDEFLKNNSFDFYGKVTDEKGNPIAGATVKILVEGELGSTQGDTEHDVQSSEDGSFQLEKIHSFGVNITVHKDGFIAQSTPGPLFWFPGRKSTMPTKEQPAVFLLRRAELKPLIPAKVGPGGE